MKKEPSPKIELPGQREKQLALIDLIVSGWAKKERFPALVEALNVRLDDKPVSRWIFDLKLVKYLKEEGEYPVGYVQKGMRVCNCISVKTKTLKDINPFAKRRARTSFPKAKIPISKERVNEICTREKYGCRLYAKRSVGKTTRLLFWHPEFGYSETTSVASYWVNNPFDPFLQVKEDKRCINDVELLIFDNYLSDIYQISPRPAVIHRSKENIRRIGIFCKLHFTHNEAITQHIFTHQTFNCPGCRKKDYFGLERIRQLKLNPKDDPGATIVYFVKLTIKTRATLKFGVTKALVNRSDEESIAKRFGSNIFTQLEPMKMYRCESELEALILERVMLTNTIGYLDREVPSSVGGATECRVHNIATKSICLRAFDEAIASK